MSDIRTTVSKDIDDAKKSVLDGIKKRNEDAIKRVKDMTTLNEIQKSDAQQKLSQGLNSAIIKLDAQQNNLMAVIDRILEVMNSYQTRVDSNRKSLIEAVMSQSKTITNRVTAMLDRATNSVRDFQKKLERK